MCASASFLPFRTGTFDYVSMLEVVEHLENEELEQALDDCKRIADYVVISTPNCDSKIWSYVVWPFWTHTIGREWIGSHKQFFDVRSLEDLLEKGFHMKILERNYSRWSLLLFAMSNPPPARVARKNREIELQPEQARHTRS